MVMERNGRFHAKNKLQRLRCSVQNYDWGRIGSDTAVARLCAANSGVDVNSSKPYAEFWMGTHESGPSFVLEEDHGALENGNGNGKCGGGLNLDRDVTLKSWIESNPDVLGNKVLQKWDGDLPFLFKVLSVAQPLSIQAHPDKVLAKELHKFHPEVYKDGNHKPEMALAVTEFEALCGFLEIKELKDVVQKVPEIKDLVGGHHRDQLLNVSDKDDNDHIKALVKLLFTQIMSAGKEQVTKVLIKLKSRLMMKDKLTPKEQLVLRLEEKYPNDVGVIAAFFMNYVKLQPGEALCLGANELHAYVSGDCVECMATSDNVVRAGLTPKKRDVKTLCSMLTYNLGFPQTLRGVSLNKYTTRYRPDFEEFEVDRCILPEGSTVSFPLIKGPSIFVITSGSGVIRTDEHGEDEGVCVGNVLFAPANVRVSVEAAAASRLELYRAGVNSEFL